MKRQITTLAVLAGLALPAVAEDGKKPESIVGRKAIVVGFWRRKEACAGLKVGDTIECALQHITPRSDHLNVGEFRSTRKSRVTEKKED
jgi:hypothetical protein